MSVSLSHVLTRWRYKVFQFIADDIVIFFIQKIIQIAAKINIYYVRARYGAHVVCSARVEIWCGPGRSFLSFFWPKFKTVKLRLHWKNVARRITEIFVSGMAAGFNYDHVFLLTSSLRTPHTLNDIAQTSYNLLSGLIYNLDALRPRNDLYRE